MTIELYRLEYCPEQNLFHFANIDDSFAKGYYALRLHVPRDEAIKFVEYAQPLLDSNTYTWQEMKEIFELWEEIEELTELP